VASQRSLPAKLKYGVQLVWWFVRNPVENVLAARDRRAAAREGWRADSAYPPDEDWEAKLHASLGAPWPCPEGEAFDQAWEQTLAELEERGLVPGREAFGGWDDGDRALARAAWCLVRHGAPDQSIETGVGRGLTTRALLTAMEANGAGRLWSIDRPPPLSPGLKRQTGAAVPERLRSRWTLVSGSSRQKLPGVVAETGSIDLFVHDSMHTTRNVEFELECIWPALSAGSVVLVDDIDMNRAFGRFAQAHGSWRLVALSDDGQRRFGVIGKA
jgi:hypothetical protein